MANKESKELVKLGVELVNAVAGALEDGKLSLLDAINLGRVLVAAGPAVDNVAGVLSEIKSWSPAERDEVLGMLRAIDLPDDQKEALLEKVLQAAFILAELFVPFLKKE